MISPRSDSRRTATPRSSVVSSLRQLRCGDRGVAAGCRTHRECDQRRSAAAGGASASVTQKGQRLIWQLKMAQSFSPGALAPDGRTLCLLIKRADNAAVTGSCASPARARDSTRRRSCLRRASAGPAAGQRDPGERHARQQPDLTASFLPSAIGATYKPLRWQVISTLIAPCGAPCHAGLPRRAAARPFPGRPRSSKLRVPQLAGLRSESSGLRPAGRATSDRLR